MKMHPLLHLIATQPHLLAEHAQAYADLVSAEIGSASSSWKNRAVYSVVALCSIFFGVGFAGVAVMLWAVVPVERMHLPWLLWVVPLAPLVVALGCSLAAKQSGERKAFGTIRDQVKADLQMLREMSSNG